MFYFFPDFKLYRLEMQMKSKFQNLDEFKKFGEEIKGTVKLAKEKIVEVKKANGFIHYEQPVLPTRYQVKLDPIVVSKAVAVKNAAHNMANSQRLLNSKRDNYMSSVHAYYGIGFFMTFIPKTNAFRTRKLFAQAVNDHKERFVNYTQSTNEYKSAKKALRAR